MTIEIIDDQIKLYLNEGQPGAVTEDGIQTLTNKTITLGSNTVTGTKAQFNAALTDGDFLFVGDAQPIDADLTAIAALTGTAGLLKKTAVNTWELDTTSYLTSSAIGSTVQAYAANLTSWAAIEPAAKQDALVSGTSIKTINSTSLLGSGDIVISGSGSEDTTTSFTYTYTGVMGVPPIPLPGSGSLLASPAGNERAFNVLFVGPANPGLTGIEFTKLEFVGGTFQPSSMAALTTLSLPALTTVGGGFNPSSMAALTSLSVPAIERIGTAITSGNAIQINAGTGALTTFELPATLKQVGDTAGNVVITSAALNQASVDSILIRLAALNGTGGTMAFSNRTVTITGTSAAPSSTGLAAKATLVARGCTVTHN